jgi:hypothetical protein
MSYYAGKDFEKRLRVDRKVEVIRIRTGVTRREIIFADFSLRTWNREADFALVSSVPQVT